ncbi:hypothetical protein V492_06892 [Pseudogymnoascus sp. VKM F-4246]|nr:hypothetical protein V492_06892 [Pseudogymnoascus sp. VKM F-4246]
MRPVCETLRRGIDGVEVALGDPLDERPALGADAAVAADDVGEGGEDGEADVPAMTGAGVGFWFGGGGGGGGHGGGGD